MRRIRIIPALLLINDGLYKTTQFKNPKYIGDPLNAVKIFNEKETDELIILDISVTKEGKSINYKKIREIAGEAFMPMGYGGGIKSFEDAKKVYDAGYEKVVLNTAAFKNADLISKIASVYGSQGVVVSIDAKLNWLGKYQVYICDGIKKVQSTVEEVALMAQAAGAGEIFLNAIHKDGTWEGYDIELIKKISHLIKLPVVACGGAASTDDFRRAVVEGGASAVSAGSMFVYQKKGMGVLINFPEKPLIL